MVTITKDVREQRWTPSFAEPDVELRQSPLFQATQKLLPLIEGLCNIADPGLWGHSLRVGKMASKVGEVLGLGVDHVERLEVAGYLHDLGKIVAGGCPAPAGQTGPDRHGLLGARAIGHIPQLSEVGPAILFHHELWDGSGSPAGLARDAIPLDARILAVVDRFDTMIAGAAGAETSRVNAGLEFLKGGSGKQFDRDVVAAFRQACSDMTVKTLFGRPSISLHP